MNLLHLIGTGTVARNKQTNSSMCYVFLPNYFPAADGLISGDANKQQVTGKSKDGTNNSSTVLSSNVFPATWINLGQPNRLSPPDVRVGSQVAIYRWGDDPELHWTTIGFGGEDMRLETVIHGFSANPNVDKNNPFSYDNFYTFEVSTHNKRVAFKTSQANGEKTKHEIALDAGKGTITFADGEGNLLALDSMSHSFIYQNQDQSKVVVNKKKIFLTCQDAMSLNAVESLTVATKTLNISAQTINIKAPTTNMEGNVNLKGDIKSEGNLDATGSISATGTIEGKTDVIGGGVSVKKHKHSGVKAGGDPSGPPM